MKNIKKNALILIAITFIVLFFVLKDDFSNIMAALVKVNGLWILVAIVCYILYLLFKALALRLTIQQEGVKFSLPHAMVHTSITQFFNGITPFSTGGQPMEIYMLKDHGIRYSKGINIILQTFIFYQTALVLYGFIAVGLNYYFHFFERVPFLRKLILLGFCINAAVIIVLFIIAFAKKLNNWILNKAINILYKLKIVKDKEVTLKQWNERLTEFHVCADHLKKNKKLLLIGTLYNILGLTCYYIIPLFLAYSMGDFTSLNPVNTIVGSAYVLIIGSFVPIPGASGGIEYGFLEFFKTFISGSVLPAMLLLWRFITYYLGMITGAIIFNLDKGGKK